MAAFKALKCIGSGGALVVLTSFLSNGVASAREIAETSQRAHLCENGSKPNTSEDERVLACTPQFDGLECFETIVRTGKHPRAAPAAPRAAPTESRQLSVAPQFDGLECFETIITTGKHPRSVNQPIVAAKKAVPTNRGLTIAPQFDGLHCFETFISKK